MTEMLATLIAPCGLNCRLCYAFMREKKPCPGCNGDGRNKPKHCVQCSIKNCPTLKTSEDGRCTDCPKPCRRFKDLDKTYREKYEMSTKRNLESIKEEGMDAFLKHEADRWTCPTCDRIVCVHSKACPVCNANRDHAFPTEQP